MAPSRAAGFAIDAPESIPGKLFYILSYITLLLWPMHKFFFDVILRWYSMVFCGRILADKDPPSKPPEEIDCEEYVAVADAKSYPIAVNVEGRSQKCGNQTVGEDFYAFLIAFSSQIARQLDCEPVADSCDDVIKVLKSKSENLSNSRYNIRKPIEEQGPNEYEEGRKAVENCCIISNTPQAFSEHNKPVNIKSIVSTHEIKGTNCSGGTSTSSVSSQQKAQQSQKRQCNQAAASTHEQQESTGGGFGDDNDPPKRNNWLPIKGHYQEFSEPLKNKDVVLCNNSEKQRSDQVIVATIQSSCPLPKNTNAPSVPSYPMQENSSATTVPVDPLLENSSATTVPSDPLLENSSATTVPLDPLPENSGATIQPSCPLPKNINAPSVPSCPMQENYSATNVPSDPLLENSSATTVPSDPLPENSGATIQPSCPLPKNINAPSVPSDPLLENSSATTVRSDPAQENSSGTTMPSGPLLGNFDAANVPSYLLPENSTATNMPSDLSYHRFHAAPSLHELMLAGPTCGRDGFYLEGRDFVVRGELGRGKYGICEKIKDISSGGLLVRKKIKRQDFERNEWIIWSTMSQYSPHVVQIFGASEDRNHVFLFMELMDGDLEHICDHGTELELNERKVLALLKPIMQGLVRIHDCNYVHADIKCKNVSYSLSSGRIVIGDFGSSSSCNDDSKLKNICRGTVPYIPKEKFWGDEDRASRDIYACGCVMIHLLTGEPPWSSYHWYQIMYKVGSGDVPAIPENCSAGVKRLLERMLNSDHKERPTARQLLLDPMFADRPSDKLDHVLEELLVDMELLRRPAVPVQDNVLDTASPLVLDDVDHWSN